MKNREKKSEKFRRKSKEKKERKNTHRRNQKSREIGTNQIFSDLKKVCPLAQDEDGRLQYFTKKTVSNELRNIAIREPSNFVNDLVGFGQRVRSKLLQQR